MINNRQNGNGRRRGRTGNAPRPNGGGQQDRGSRLDNRARGNASQLHEKYKTLAADAQRQGDRVLTEYYLQFADHYFRVLSENRSRFEDQQPRRERFEGAGDDFDESDGEQAADGLDERPAERQRGQDWDREPDGYRERNRNEGQRSDVGRSEGNRSEGNRADGNRGEGNRNDGNRSEGNRAERPRGEGVRGYEGPRADAGREGQERADERDYRQPRQPREGFEPRTRRDRPEPEFARPLTAQADSEAAPVVPMSVAPVGELPLDAPVPERRPRGRPRKVVVPVAEESERIEMDRLPPALVVEQGDAASAEAKPRRTRRPRGEAITA